MTKTKQKKSALPTGLDSKRQLLEYLQKHCSIDFLRSKGLNSNPDGILRKTNKKALMPVWAAWISSQKHNQPEHSGDRIESLYQELLQPPMSDSKDAIKVVAGTLHETCEEFPCFGLEDSTLDSSPKSYYQICLFLGAVRDMSVKENEALEKACRKSSVPLVGIRFGTVPEFTSKILSILAFHHYKMSWNDPSKGS